MKKTKKRITFKIYKKDYDKVKISKIPLSFFLREILQENRKTIKKNNEEETIAVSYFPKQGEKDFYNKENRKYYKELFREKIKKLSIKL